MVVRVIAKNILSFKEITEFNLTTSSKIRGLSNHKIKVGKFSLLKFSAIYGSNASGKSNLVKVLYLLKKIVVEGKIPLLYQNQYFRFDSLLENEPSEIALEFLANNNIYFYSVSFLQNKFVSETLFVKKREVYEKVFHREILGKEIYIEGVPTEQATFFGSVLREDTSFLYFIGNGKDYRGKEIFSTPLKEVYNWFEENLLILFPDSKPNFTIFHILNINNETEDLKSKFKDKIDNLINILNLGISEIDFINNEITVEKLKEIISDEAFNEIANANDGLFNVLRYKDLMIIKDIKNNKFYNCSLKISQVNNFDVKTEFKSEELSDGTNRLIELTPMFLSKLDSDKTIVIDEIERSLHPNMIKSILSFFSESISSSGQLIFTTHESNLLDLKLFRQDEIYFVEKNAEYATELYPLSDFSVHHTKDIQNGYLQGRYGAIPFLGDFKKLLNLK